MLEGIPRISVYMITYNQDDVIDRTLGSILNQIDYVYEICVSDDCSTDRTWDILNEYASKYPGLFKLNRNSPNLGIFENTEKVWTMPTGDILYDLAGDDSVEEGWFKTVVEYIKDNNINIERELFCIYGDYKCVYPNGDSIVYSHSAIQRKPNNSLRLSLRGIICGRGCCFSKRILERFEKVSCGRSHKVEHAQDRQLQMYAEKNYYIPQVANIYYANIGVSTKVQSEETYQDRLEIWPFTIRFLNSKNIKVHSKDMSFGKYNIAVKRFRYKPSLVRFIIMVYYYIISRDLSLPLGNGLKHFCFALARRIPHTRPIHFD